MLNWTTSFPHTAVCSHAGGALAKCDKDCHLTAMPSKPKITCPKRIIHW